jgi:transposase
MVWLEADAPRVSCRAHGVVVASVPWARHGAGHTYAFDATAAYLATQAAKSMVVQLLRVAWRTVGSIIARVFADLDATSDRLDGLRRIGIDEISYKRGHKYLIVVVDHDRRALVWAAPGRDKATVAAFFDELGPDRCQLITHVSADGAAFIADVVADKCRNAVQCADPFHIVSWATDALDEVRRQVWNEARRMARAEPRRPRGRPRADAPPRPASELAGQLKGARYALWKNPENLTEHQTQRLAWIATTSPKLHRAYLLKEGHSADLPDDLRRRGRGPGEVADLGPALPDPGVHRVGRQDHPPPGTDPRRGRAQPLQCAGREHQHESPVDHPQGLRLPITRRPHRPGDAHSGARTTRPPRPKMTHGCITRARFSPPSVSGAQQAFMAAT